MKRNNFLKGLKQNSSHPQILTYDVINPTMAPFSHEWHINPINEISY